MADDFTPESEIAGKFVARLSIYRQKMEREENEERGLTCESFSYTRWDALRYVVEAIELLAFEIGIEPAIKMLGYKPVDGGFDDE